MDVGLIGLGRMGGNMATRLVRGGHRIVGFDPSSAARQAAQTGGIETAASLRELVTALPIPRVVWIMVPAGEPTEIALRDLAELLAPGDTIVEGGNTHYKDDVRRAPALVARGLRYVDAGVSGGIWGLTEGYCLMVGGERAQPRSQARRDQGLGRGFGRGPVDDRRCRRESGGRAGDHGIALRALPLTSRELVRGPAARRAPQRLRWPCRPSMSRSRR